MPDFEHVSREFFSPGYARTIRRAVHEMWQPDPRLPFPRTLWPFCVYESERVGMWRLDRIRPSLCRLELMLSGELEYLIGGQRFVSKKGDLFVSPAGMDVTVRSVSGTPCSRLGLELGGALLDTLLRLLRLEMPRNLKAAETEFETAARKLYALLSEKRAGSEPEICGLSFTLLTTAASLAARADRGGAYPAQLVRALNLIHGNLTADFRSPELAAEASCSVPTLDRMFRRTLKTSPRSYATEYKLRQARALLRTGELSVKEVSDRLGWKNPFYFSRVYRRRFGLPPSADRGTVRGDASGPV